MHDIAKARRIKDVLADQVLIFIFAAELDRNQLFDDHNIVIPDSGKWSQNG